MESKIDKAQAALDRATEKRQGWIESRGALSGQVAEAKGSLGYDVAAGDAGATTRLADLRARLEAASAAVTACDSEVESAREAVTSAEAADLEARAAESHRRADEHQEVTDGLVAQLQEHEGCPFVPQPPPTMEQLTQAGMAGLVVYTPKTQLMRNEALDLEAQSAEKRRQMQAARAAREQADRDQARREWVAYEKAWA